MTDAQDPGTDGDAPAEANSEPFRGNASAAAQSRADMVSGGIAVGMVLASNRIILLVLYVVLARVLGASGLGVYAFAISLVTLVSILSELGFPLLVEREIAKSSASNEWGHGKGMIYVAGVAQLVVGGASCVLLVALSGFFEHSLSIVIAALLIPLLGLFRVGCHVLSGAHEIVLSRLMEYGVRPLLVMVSVVLAFLINPEWRTPEAALTIQVIVIFVTLLVLYLIIQRVVPTPMRRSNARFRLGAWWRSAVTLTFGVAAVTINTQFDVIILGWFYPSSDVGIYRIASQGAALIGLAFLAANMYLSPQFSKLWAGDRRSDLQRLVTQAVRWVSIISIATAALLGWVGEWLLGTFFGEAFVVGYMPMMVLACGYVIASISGAFGSLLNMTGHEREAAKAIAVGAVVNVVLSLALVPPFGMEGAAYGTLIAALVWHLLLSRGIRRTIGIRPTVAG